MTDMQLQKKIRFRRLIILSVVLLLISGGLFYYRLSTEQDYSKYQSDKEQEQSLEDQISLLETETNKMQADIEETGKELVSFSEDKIKYINLASELSTKYNVKINKLSVSDIWTEGQMSIMTTDIEVDGSMKDISQFIQQYCGSNYTNRINKISGRPVDRYPWLVRTIDDEKILTWFDLSEEQDSYDNYLVESGTNNEANRFESGIAVAPEGTELATEDFITLADMFNDKTFRVYIQIDFLGRN